jgi:hypothetical protein
MIINIFINKIKNKIINIKDIMIKINIIIINSNKENSMKINKNIIMITNNNMNNTINIIINIRNKISFYLK